MEERGKGGGKGREKEGEKVGGYMVGTGEVVSYGKVGKERECQV